jgi:hypothetical protein
MGDVLIDGHSSSDTTSDLKLVIICSIVVDQFYGFFILQDVNVIYGLNFHVGFCKLGRGGAIVNLGTSLLDKPIINILGILGSITL